MTVLTIARLALDLLAISALIHGLFLPRHHRTDLAVVFALFNVGLFLALVVISAGDVSVGVGFGLFAVLSIVRLRSEPFSNRELAYCFVAIVLALVCAIDLGSIGVNWLLVAVALGATWIADQHPPQHRMFVTLEQVFPDAEGLRHHLELRLNAHVLDVNVTEVDYVRETTHAEVQYTPIAKEVTDATVALA